MVPMVMIVVMILMSEDVDINDCDDAWGLGHWWWWEWCSQDGDGWWNGGDQEDKEKMNEWWMGDEMWSKVHTNIVHASYFQIK